MKKESEFGKGLVLCLVYFTEHFEKLCKTSELIAKHEQVEPLSDYQEASIKIWGSFERFVSNKITLWANGATDHLYEMEIPKGKEWSAIRKKVKQLKDKGLAMGHGFTDQTYTMDDAKELIKLTKEIALEIDKIIGLNPIEGTWQ